MNTTRIWQLIIVAAASALASATISKLMVLSGAALPELPRSLLVTLPSIAIVLGVLGWPMVRYRRALKEALSDKKKPRPKRPDSFYAVRVLLLSKAAALAGSLFFGWSVGVAVVQLTAPIAVWHMLLSNLSGAVGALFLTIVAILIERACRLPDDAVGGSDAGVASA